MLFYSYAHQDESLRKQLEVHLSLLRRQGLILEWHDRKIAAGTEWAQQIDEHLESAQLVLLLISPDFLASDYCYDTEMQRALERNAQGEARVIPIILRPCDWQDARFARLQALPHDGKAVTEWDNQDAAFRDVVRGIRTAIEQFSLISTQPQLVAVASEKAPATASRRVPLSRAASIEQQNRERLIQRVRNFWIKGIFEKSLYNAALMTLGLQESPETVENPWRLVLQESEHASTPLPAGTRITEVYDDAGGELLILGEPGAGKTTLLLELARDLLERSEQDQAHPIPIVFNLSSWTQKRHPLTTWLIEEMETKYQVPRKVASDWINANQILPLLDGLDEVDGTSRTACMQTINEYHRAHSLVPLVVCCRVNEYMSQANRLALSRAVTIQPLTIEQVSEYLVRIGEQVASLHMAFQNDPVLQEIATTPLMLTILILAYQDSSLEEIEGGVSTEERQQQIFTTYMQRMLRRRSVETRYTSEQTKHWLTWLAQQMRQRNQAEFYIERLQPDWLPKGYLYNCIAVRLVNGLVGALVFGLVGGLVFEQVGTPLGGPVFGQVGGLVFGLIGGLAFGLFNSEDIEKMPTETLVWSWVKTRRSLTKSLAIGLISGLIATLVGVGIGSPPASLVSALSFGLVVGLAVGLVVGLVIGLVKIESAEITPAEVMTWSWVKMQRSLIKSLTIGLVGGLVVGFVAGFVIGLLAWQLGVTIIGLVSGPLDLLITGLIGALGLGTVGTLTGALGGGLISGFSSETLERRNRVVPNQGIRRSVQNSIFVGSVSALIGGLGGWLSFGLGVGLVKWITFGSGDKVITGLTSALSNGLVNGLAVGASVGTLVGMLIGWLPNGGAASTKHAILRLLLWRARYIPWNYPRFLDYAAERIVLRKVGGGYIFIHRLLLEYFASLEEKQDLHKKDAYEHKEDL